MKIAVIVVNYHETFKMLSKLLEKIDYYPEGFTFCEFQTDILDICFSPIPYCQIFMLFVFLVIDGSHVEESNTNEMEEFGQDDYSLDAMDVSDTIQSIDPLWDTAHFLLRVTQEQSLTYTGVENFCDSMQDYNETICNKITHQIEHKLKHHQGSVLDDVISKDILSAIATEDNFSSLKSRYSREKYYEKYFNYKVQCTVSALL